MRDETALVSEDTADWRQDTGRERYTRTDDEIAQIVADAVQTSSSAWNSGISGQRENALKHYYGEKFGNERNGFSQHVSREVFESVEDLKTDLLNAFTSGPRPLRFTQEQDDNSPQAATDATDFVYGIFFRQLDGYNLLHDAIHDALIGKLCCARRHIETTTEVSSEIVEVPAGALPVIEQEPDVVAMDVLDSWFDTEERQTPEGWVVGEVEILQVEVRREREVSRIAVDVVAPENTFLGDETKAPNDQDTVILKFKKTRSQLVKEGFDEDALKKLGRNSTYFTGDETARHSVDGSDHDDYREGEYEREYMDVFEAYMEIDLDGDGIGEKWKFTVVGDKLLDKEQVQDFGLHFWTPYRIPHKAIGLSVADLTMDVQRTTSSFIRGVVDNIHLTNASTRIADLQVVRNPRDVIDNRIGTVIDSPDPSAVAAIQQPQLNPQTFEAINLLKSQKDERTGQSRLRSGHNMDAVSHQNSADLINAMMQAGGRRPSQMARSFAETFLKPLFRGIYKLGVELGTVIAVPTARGATKVLDSSDWLPERESMEIQVALTETDRFKRAAALSNTYQMLDQNMQLAPLFGLEERYRLICDIMEATECADPAYLKNPASPEGQEAVAQANAQMQQAQAMEQQQAQMVTQVQIEKIRADAQAKMAQIALDEKKATSEAYIRGQEIALERDEFEHKQWVDREELRLEEKQGEDLGRKTNIG